MPVPALMAVTFAPGKTAPVASRIVPRILPRSDCAYNPTQHVSTKTTNFQRSDMEPFLQLASLTVPLAPKTHTTTSHLVANGHAVITRHYCEPCPLSTLNSGWTFRMSGTVVGVSVECDSDVALSGSVADSDGLPVRSCCERIGCKSVPS